MDWRYNTVWFDQLPDGMYGALDFDDRTQAKLRLDGYSYALARKFRSKSFDLEDFPADEAIQYLDLEQSNIHSFTGLSRFGRVKRLEAHYCLKLANDGGLSDVKDSLEWLHINQSKKFSVGEELLSLHNLKVLCLNSCAPLADLDFLSAFPKLVDFRFVDTNVLSGDLTPLMKHPTLCSVGFLNKRHYNVSEIEADDHFSRKKMAAIEKVYKGQWETFRYIALDDA
ncbi:MAG: hypothetical protein WA049_15955 [Ferribacterium limneticum]